MQHLSYFESDSHFWEQGAGRQNQTSLLQAGLPKTLEATVETQSIHREPRLPLSATQHSCSRGKEEKPGNSISQGGKQVSPPTRPPTQPPAIAHAAAAAAAAATAWGVRYVRQVYTSLYSMCS